MNWEIIGCVDDGCDRPAESVPMYMTMNPAGGFIVHRRVRCVDGHVFYIEQCEGPRGQEAPPSTFCG